MWTWKVAMHQRPLIELSIWTWERRLAKNFVIPVVSVIHGASVHHLKFGLYLLKPTFRILYCHAFVNAHGVGTNCVRRLPTRLISILYVSILFVSFGWACRSWVLILSIKFEGARWPWTWRLGNTCCDMQPDNKLSFVRSNYWQNIRSFFTWLNRWLHNNGILEELPPTLKKWRRTSTLVCSESKVQKLSNSIITYVVLLGYVVSLQYFVLPLSFIRCSYGPTSGVKIYQTNEVKAEPQGGTDWPSLFSFGTVKIRVSLDPLTPLYARWGKEYPVKVENVKLEHVWEKCSERIGFPLRGSSNDLFHESSLLKCMRGQRYVLLTSIQLYLPLFFNSFQRGHNKEFLESFVVPCSLMRFCSHYEVIYLTPLPSYTHPQFPNSSIYTILVSSNTDFSLVMLTSTEEGAHRFLTITVSSLYLLLHIASKLVDFNDKSSYHAIYWASIVQVERITSN